MFQDNKNFYPTPLHIINKMLDKIDFKIINNVLEPSAGKGDILEIVKNKFKYSRNSYNRDINFDIDCIEIDENLQHILRGKNFRIVHNDFLTYNSYKKYSLIVMNPPFENGDKHLLKALKMQESGGKIVCLLNAETLKNPYSNTRKDLIQQLDKYNAEIEYIENAFYYAERKTSVEIALIYIDIPKNYNDNSIILEQLQKEEQYRTETDQNNCLINNDFIKGIVEQYNFEAKAGIKLIAEYNALKPYMLSSLKEGYNNSSILELSLNGKDQDNNCSLENGYIKQLRMKYWTALFTSDQFMGLFTSNLREKYYNKIQELRNYDFSLYNIYNIRIQLNKEMIQGVEDTIINLFDELSHKHYWDNDFSSNIHYYNGWKTNQAYKINKKVIIPLSCYSWSGYLQLTYGNTFDKLTDIEKVFNYLDNCETEELDIKEALKFAEHYGDTKKIELKYFYVTFYKKGTCHIEFKNLELLHKFNVFGSQRKNWLPPSYGKVKYKDMTTEEKAVINEFEGENSYNKVILKKDYYIYETSNLLLLA